MSVAFSVLSAFLLIFAFPPYDLWFLSWLALVPFLWALDERGPAAGFLIGYLFGLVFFAGMFFWLVNMAFTAGIPLLLSFLAAVLLVVYCAAYTGLWGWAYCAVRGWPVFLNLVFLPSFWVVLEFTRDRLFSGFGWASLGHSQYRVLPVIQIADLTGVFGVSFGIVLVSLAIKEALAFLFGKSLRRGAMVLSLGGAALFLGVVLFYGQGRIRFFEGQESPSLRVAVIQANIAQQRKWDPEEWPQILAEHELLTEKSLAQKPDLIVWPETSFPGYIWADAGLFERLKKFNHRLNVPLLIGAVTFDGEDYYNSAFLLQGGHIGKKHHKLHLVPFGEYVPLRRQIPFLDMIVPIEDFTPGQALTVFSLAAPDGGEVFFSVLICFEDTISPVARRLTGAGAGMLINITNDAWYLKSKAPYLHMQAGVFQAVQNRRNLVRAANTGVSGFITPIGAAHGFVEDAFGEKVYIPGFSVQKVGTHSGLSFYTKFGDVFAYFCFGSILFCAIIKMLFFKNMQRKPYRRSL